MKHRILLFATVLVFFISCNVSHKKNNPEAERANKDVSHVETSKESENVHWSHHAGEHGPENWKNLSEAYEACGGKSQSPVNIVTDSVLIGQDLSKLEFDYENSKMSIINNGHTIQFNIKGKNHVTVNGKEYSLLQFHYHATSEHTINGVYSPLEVHFVHKHSDSDYAVIGVMYEKGVGNELFNKYLDKFPALNEEYSSEDMLDVLKILPQNKSYYYYKGSLTTPPCSEVVNWYVLKNPIEASEEQINKFATILNGNFRPVQKLNGREVKLYQE